VWNEIMRKEAMELYGYDSEDIFVSGAPQFDVYFRRDALLPRDEFLRSVSLDPEKKVITYCTQGKIKYQSLEIEAIKVILRRARERGFGDDCQLIIRLHPGASPDRFLELKGEDVYVDSPGHSEIWLDGWDPGGADMRHLGNIIQSSDVVINIASTITIDASCLDRPVINIAFDADHPRPYWDSVARGYEYTHYRNIVRTSGVRLAKSKNELLDYVSAYLKDPRLDSEGRKRIVSEQCCYTDGKSGKRVADYVLSFLRSVTSQDRCSLAN
jgi:CDP-glycerol glycerophosphotransferase (TagB/SpsB family)